MIKSDPKTKVFEKLDIGKNCFRSYEISFYVLVTCGHYFVQYGFFLICLFNLFTGATSFSHLSVFSFFFVSSVFWTQCHHLYNHYLYKCCMLYDFFLTLLFIKPYKSHENLIITCNKNYTSRQVLSFFQKSIFMKKNVNSLKNERSVWKA